MNDPTTFARTDLLKILVDNGKGTELVLQKLADIFPSVIYMYNADEKKYTFLNNKVTDLLGYSESELNKISNELLQITADDDKPEVLKKLSHLINQPDAENIQYNSHLIHKDGTHFLVKTEGSVVDKNESGKPRNILFFVSHFSQEAVFKNETIQQNKFFGGIEERLFFGNWTWDKLTGLMTWSDGMFSMFGYTEDELTIEMQTRLFFDQVVEKDRERFEKCFRKSVEENTPFNINYQFILKDGSVKNMLTHGKLVTTSNNEAICMMGSTFDITAQLKSHQDLKNFKELMYENERLLGYGTWVFNFATNSIQWSDGMFQLFGYDPEKDRDRLKIDEDIYSKHMDSQGMQTIKEKRKKFLEKGINEYTWEYEINTNDFDEKKRIESYSRLVRDENGNPIQIVGTSRDITRLRQYERSLEEKVKDLDRSNKELEEFAYIASHDLQEPLRKLTTFSERLQQKFADKLDEDGNAYLVRMLNATGNMRMLIDNLLEYSRTTSSSALFEPCDLNILVKKVLSDLELNIEETNTIIQINELPVLDGIPGQLSQLFINILGNAIKFRIPGKSPEINIKSRLLKPSEKTHHILDASRNYYKLTIADNGIGFEEEYAKRIFQIFQRLHSKAEYPGTGIGLSICKKIVENHKGIIYAKGHHLHGAKFTIILPEYQ